jgi:hypothetical protein
VTPADNSLAASSGMSGSMTPSPRRRIPRREAVQMLVETLVEMRAETLVEMRAETLMRSGGHRRDAGDGDLSTTSPLPPCACSMLLPSSRFGKHH